MADKPKKPSGKDPEKYDFRAGSLKRVFVSLLLGAAISWVLGGIIAFFFNNQYLGWASSIYIFFFGLKYLNENEEGVPKIFGQYSDFFGYRLPPGLSWFFPWPIGDAAEVVMTERTSDHRKSNNNIIEVLSWDNIEIKMSFLVQFEVFDSLRFVLIEQPISALEAVIERTARWFANIYIGNDLPRARKIASDFIAGKLKKIGDIKIYIDEKGEPRLEKEKDWELKPMDEEEFKEIASSASVERLGMRLKAAFVDDFGLPKEMVEARAQIRVEQSQIKSEGREMESLAERVAQIDNMGDKYEDMDPEFKINTVQALQGKAKKTVIENRGGAGDVTTAAAVFSDRRGD